MNLRPPRTLDKDARGGRITLAFYRGVVKTFSPALPLLLLARARRGKEDLSRINERRGYPSQQRPEGVLIWIHGASVGESLAALPLIECLLEKPDRAVLVTTGTVTSAKLMAERLPDRAMHQYVPIDWRPAVKKFLNYWRPNLALFIESELWPNLILETHARGVPMGLVNARLSAESLRGWMHARGLARRLLSCFDVCLAQNAGIAARLTALGAATVQISGSLKADAPPLPVDDAAFAAFRSAVGTRPMLLAASTHPGEEEHVLQAAASLRDKYPDVLTIIVPRHPSRGEEVGVLCSARGFSSVRRTTGALSGPSTQVYIVDTMGELGLFYRAAPFAFLGGSLIPRGGQNPLEPARFGTAVLAGPHTQNFDEIFRVLFTAQGSGRVQSATELAAAAAELIDDPGKAKRMGALAKEAAGSLGGALAITLETAEKLLAQHART